MSDPTPSSAAVTSAVHAPDEVTAAGAVASNTNKVDLNTKVATVEDLRKKAPQVWQAMIKGIATTMINQFHDQSNRIVEMMKEAERKNEGY